MCYSSQFSPPSPTDTPTTCTFHPFVIHGILPFSIVASEEAQFIPAPYYDKGLWLWCSRSGSD